MTLLVAQNGFFGVHRDLLMELNSLPPANDDTRIRNFGKLLCFDL